jgi:hypothetical protein
MARAASLAGSAAVPAPAAGWLLRPASSTASCFSGACRCAGTIQAEPLTHGCRPAITCAQGDEAQGGIAGGHELVGLADVLALHQLRLPGRQHAQLAPSPSAPVSLPARPAISTSAAPAPRCIPGPMPATSAAPSSCASKTPTWNARRRKRCRPSSTAWSGWAWSTTKARSTRCSAWTATAKWSAQMLDAGTAYHVLLVAGRSRGDARAHARRRRKAALRRHLASGAGQDLPAVPAGRRKPVVRFKNPLDGEVSWDDVVKGTITIGQQGARRPGHRAPGRHADLQLLRGGRRLGHAITHVLRGDDHVNNTPRQINILRAIGARCRNTATCR